MAHSKIELGGLRTQTHTSASTPSNEKLIFHGGKKLRIQWHILALI